MCLSLKLARLSPAITRAAILATGSPITVSHYRSRRMRARVESLLAGQPDFVFVFSGAMAQYLPERVDWPLRRIIDFADVDSDKWAQYARQRKALKLDELIATAREDAAGAPRASGAD